MRRGLSSSRPFWLVVTRLSGCLDGRQAGRDFFARRLAAAESIDSHAFGTRY